MTSKCIISNLWNIDNRGKLCYIVICISMYFWLYTDIESGSPILTAVLFVEFIGDKRASTAKYGRQDNGELETKGKGF